MFPIAVVLVVGLSIAIERYIYLTHVPPRAIGSSGIEIVPMLSQGNFRQVVQITSKSDSAIGQILNYGLARIQAARRRDDIEKAMEESLMEVVPRLEKRTHYLATFANLATLLGLLGTVMGLINAFAAVATRQPGGEGQPALRQHLGGHELHGVRTDDGGAAAVHPRVPADQDHRADRQPGDGLGEVPERHHRASPEPPAPAA